MKKIICLIIAAGLLLGACSATASLPASVDVATMEATEVTTANSDAVENEEWHGLPIMAEAIILESNTRYYSFTVSTPAEEIQAFYTEELELRGFTFVIPGGRYGWSEADSAGDALHMEFTGNRSLISIVIIPSGEVSTVILKLLRGSTS